MRAMRTRGLFRPLAIALSLLAALVGAGGLANGDSMDRKSIADRAKAALLAKHGAAEQARIDRGVDQIASLWQPADGDLVDFALTSFLPQGRDLDATLDRFEHMLEQIDGHQLEIGRALKEPAELDLGPLLPVDSMFAGYDPSAHLADDLFGSKLAFVALLNFPLTTLAERLANGPDYTRRQWAAVRLAGRFALRIPAAVQQEVARAGADADLYIAGYNIWMHHVVDEHGGRAWPKGVRLISHWNLRDELIADYAEPHGLGKQRTIVQIMTRIITQTIPGAVIDNPRLDWNPFTNAVSVAPAAEIEADAPSSVASADGAREPDIRYAKLLANFHAARAADPYAPSMPTALARSFEAGRELPEARVTAMLEEILGSKLVFAEAKLIEQRLGRKLEPTDLWFNGFKSRARFTEADLDAIVRKRYPDARAFAADIPRILVALGFSAERAAHVAGHIVVDPARGAGHAMQAARRGDDPHLRTRIEKDGMTYKGYNIAVHELGHNVEQVFSLYEVDHTLLAGVPNNAFTEALAFVFQKRDLELLGVVPPGHGDAEAERNEILGTFWTARQMSGVALVDIRVWHWMYDHPNATPAELRVAVVDIADDVWHNYFEPILGGKNTPLLAVYSHMISYPLYLPDYVIGNCIAFQIEEKLAKQGGAVGPEFERMATFGSVAPDLWMEHATGAPVGTAALLSAAATALAAK